MSEFPSLLKLSEYHIVGLPWWLSSKESTYSTGDVDSVPGLGRSPGRGNGNPLQYSCRENPIDRGAWWVTKSWTQLSTHSCNITLSTRHSVYSFICKWAFEHLSCFHISATVNNIAVNTGVQIGARVPAFSSFAQK